VGKEVYVSSSILVRDQKEYRDFRNLAQRVRRVEINSPAFLKFARYYPAVAGMFLNVYNSAAADILAEHMIQRIVLPPELCFQSVASIAKKCRVETELIVHGHVPIAIAGSCKMARSLGLNGHGCGNLCQSYPEGVVFEAGDQSLFRIEGPQTLSAATYCLVEYLPQLEEAGVYTVRILPQWNHTARVVCIYRDVLEHRRDCKDALEELKAISPLGLCNGWILGKAGWMYESPNVPSKSTEMCSQSLLLSDGWLKEESTPEPHDAGDVTLEDCCSSWSSEQILRELDQLVEMMNGDPQFSERLARFRGTTVVLSATDTKREFIIELDEQGVCVRLYTGESSDVKIQAAEQVLWAVLSGQMDADAAFFAGKVRIRGSVATAFRVKNGFLSFIQKHLARRLGANNKLAVNS
jgi:predicted lipid carrier protein YhbT